MDRRRFSLWSSDHLGSLPEVYFGDYDVKVVKEVMIMIVIRDYQ